MWKGIDVGFVFEFLLLLSVLCRTKPIDVDRKLFLILAEAFRARCLSERVGQDVC